MSPPSFTLVWEFLVQAGREEKFRALYGPHGGWAALFARHPGFLATRLLADRDQPGRFVTVDQWRSAEAWQEFRDQFPADYAALDNSALTENKVRTRLATTLGRWAVHPWTGIPLIILALYFIYLFVGRFVAQDVVDFTETKLGNELLKPTRIYVKAFLSIRDTVKIKGMAHITGGGVPGNVPRILPKGLRAVIQSRSWPVPHIFSLIQKLGNVPEHDMQRTFNMGVGYVMIVSKRRAGDAVSMLNQSGYKAFIIGKIERGTQGVRYL